MRPKTVVASRDPKSSYSIPRQGPDAGGESHRHILGSVESICWNDNNERGTKPIDVFVPILECDWLVTDVFIGSEQISDERFL